MRSTLAAVLFVFGGLTPAIAHAAPMSLDVSVDAHGRYEVRSPLGTFGGEIDHPLSSISATEGQDALGGFHEINFQYLDGSRSSGIRVYQATSVVLFSTTYIMDGPNAEPFPVLSSYPRLPYTLSYRDTPFSPYQLNTLA